MATHFEAIAASRSGSLKDVYVNVSYAFLARGPRQNPKEWARLVDSIRAVVDRGAKVFVGSGNMHFNMLTTIPGVITVGATPTDPKTGAPDRTFYVKNDEVDVRASGRVEFRPVQGGYDFTGDGTLDFPHPDPKPRRPVFGTSAATPRALAEAIRTGIVPKDENEAPASQQEETVLEI